MEQGGAGRRFVLAALVAVLTSAVSVAAAAGPNERGSGRASGGTDWVQRALALQYELGHDVELRNAPWVGTHNSFSSEAEMGMTPGAQGYPNQRITIVEQLEASVRNLEIDLHYVPDPRSGGKVVKVCHALGGGHAPCSIEKNLDVVLDEISTWLRAPANDEEVLFLYLQNALYRAPEEEGEEGYDEAATTLEQKLGDLIHVTSSTSCTQIPLSLTRREMLDDGERVLVVTNRCGLGAKWNGLIHSWDDDPQTGRKVQQEKLLKGYEEFPRCDPEPGWGPRAYRRLLIRYWETSTTIENSLGVAGDPIPPLTAAQMARCGVELVHVDMLTGPDDQRLRALVWSWAAGQPTRGRCAFQRVTRKEKFGRWYAQRCAKKGPIACRDGDEWAVSERRVKPRRGKAACRRQDSIFAVPRTGYENQLLRLAMEEAGAKRVWLGYRKRHGTWTALDRR